MKNYFKIVPLLLFLFCTVIDHAEGEGVTNLPDTSGIPHLQKNEQAIQLMVDGKPYLVLGGELHNSSSSSLAYMKPIWARLRKAHLNTVLAPVSWELIEPQQGKFDFHLVDGMIRQARENSLHLILLWFGSWKNSTSTYAPIWIKKPARRSGRDEKKFPLVLDKNGKRLNILSPFSEQTLKADAHAYARLMKYIKIIDGRQHTVIMVQVENEVGILGDSRDYSSLANKAFAQPVPESLINYLKFHKENLRKNIYDLWEKNGFKTSGDWVAVFGKGTATNEIFMAWQYARFINEITKEGKAMYPLPMYVNAWIVQPHDKAPGDYPGGGPQAHVHDIWKAAAPDIDILAPDVYLPHFEKICNEYVEAGKGFFVPESLAGEEGAANAFYAIGSCKAIGYSPFGVDGIKNLQEGAISKAYNILSPMRSLILQAQAKGTVQSVSLNKAHVEKKIHAGDYILDVTLRRNWDGSFAANQGYAMIITVAPDEYFIAGNDFQISFSPASGSQMVGFDYVEDGTFQQHKWLPGRRLNGDEISSRNGNVVRVENNPAIRKVKVYNY